MFEENEVSVDEGLEQLDALTAEAEGVEDPKAKSIIEKALGVVSGIAKGLKAPMPADDTEDGGAGDEDEDLDNDSDDEDSDDDEDEDEDEGDDEGDEDELPSKLKKGMGEFGDDSDLDLDDLAGYSIDEDSDLEKSLDEMGEIDDEEPQIDVTDLIADVHAELKASNAERAELKAEIAKSHRAQRKLAGEVEELRKGMSTNAEAIANGFLELQKSMLEQSTSAADEQSTLMKSMLDQIAEIGASPAGTPTGRATVKGDDLQKSGLMGAGDLPAAPQVRFGLTDSQLIKGLGNYLRDHTDASGTNEYGFGNDILLKATQKPVNERDESLYKAACIGLGAKFIPES